jgi:hypothetical protein
MIFSAEAQYRLNVVQSEKIQKESSNMIIAKFRNEFSDAINKGVGRTYLLLTDDFVGLDIALSKPKLL